MLVFKLFFCLFLFSQYASCDASVLKFKKEIRGWPKSSPSQDFFPLFKRLVEGRPSFVAKPRIEKIIHQIWLGGPVPARFGKAMDSWKQIHPDWKYMLWTDEDVENFALENKKYFDEGQNYGIKSDLFRIEILYRYGGLYVDCDQYCIKPHDIFHHCCDLYVGTVHEDITTRDFANSLIGAKKNHSFILKLIQGIAHSRKICNSTDAEYTLNFTGPYYFSRMISEHLNGCPTFLACPKSFFAPIPLFEDWGPCPEILELTCCQKYFQSFTYSVQFHTCSWLKPMSLP